MSGWCGRARVKKKGDQGVGERKEDKRLHARKRLQLYLSMRVSSGKPCGFG